MINDPHISVIIPTHNPNRERLERTLTALRKQTLPQNEWELCIIDNASDRANRVPDCAVDWHAWGCVISESKPGVAQARRAGIASTKAPLIVCVDDDNVLAKDYLATARSISIAHPSFGAFGGITAPEWEIPPPAWTKQFHPYLAIRDFGPNLLHTYGDRFGPDYTPNGAGMVLRREVAERWVSNLSNRPELLTFGRTGVALGSHEDIDMAWTSFQLGMEVAYTPMLHMKHLIPANRLTRSYLARLIYGMAWSGEFFVATRTGSPPAALQRYICIRKLKRYILTGAAWKPAAYIWWRHYCGKLDARAAWHKANSRDATPPIN